MYWATPGLNYFRTSTWIWFQHLSKLLFISLLHQTSSFKYSLNCLNMYLLLTYGMECYWFFLNLMDSGVFFVLLNTWLGIFACRIRSWTPYHYKEINKSLIECAFIYQPMSCWWPACRSTFINFFGIQITLHFLLLK